MNLVNILFLSREHIVVNIARKHEIELVLLGFDTAGEMRFHAVHDLCNRSLTALAPVVVKIELPGDSFAGLLHPPNGVKGADNILKMRHQIECPLIGL